MRSRRSARELLRSRGMIRKSRRVIVGGRGLARSGRACVVVLGLMGMLQVAQSAAEQSLVLTGGALVGLPGAGARSADLHDAVVVISGDRIVAAGPRDSTTV